MQVKGNEQSAKPAIPIKEWMYGFKQVMNQGTVNQDWQLQWLVKRSFTRASTAIYYSAFQPGTGIYCKSNKFVYSTRENCCTSFICQL
jgi:hypothetical protein